MNMHPVHSITNETSQPISDAFLREEYGITEQYSKDHPEASVKVLLVARSIEEALRAAKESAQSSKKLTNGLARLREDNKILRAQQLDLIELEEKNTQALRKLAQSSSELREMTSSIANFANRFFKPVQNGWNYFCFLTGYRTPVAALPRENLLAIEDNPENIISNTDPTNQPSVNKKKLHRFTQVLYGCRRILCFVFEGTKNLLMLIYRSSIKKNDPIILY